VEEGKKGKNRKIGFFCLTGALLLNHHGTFVKLNILKKKGATGEGGGGKKERGKGKTSRASSLSITRRVVPLLCIKKRRFTRYRWLRKKKKKKKTTRFPSLSTTTNEYYSNIYINLQRHVIRSLGCERERKKRGGGGGRKDRKRPKRLVDRE